MSINKQIEELSEICRELGSVNSIHRIEKDIMLSKIREAYELVLMLNTKVEQAEAQQNEPHTAIVDSNENTGIQEMSIAEPAIAPAKTQSEPALPNSRTEKISSATGTLFDETPSDGKHLISAVSSLNEKRQTAVLDMSIGEKLGKKPLIDLKKSIGINEKFLFVNELFDGNLQEYNECIDVLNQAASKESAMELLDQNFIQKYNWDSENEARVLLSELVSRRYS